MGTSSAATGTDAPPGSAAELGEAVRRLKIAREKGCGETFDATAIGGLSDATLQAYERHLN